MNRVLREDDILRDFSNTFCVAKSKSKTLFWLPCSEEDISLNSQECFSSGIPTVDIPLDWEKAVVVSPVATENFSTEKSQ
jgi:hypothetical protein